MIDFQAVPFRVHCTRAPAGWWCSLPVTHAGPCAPLPRWWNLRARWAMRGLVHRLPGAW